MVPRPRTPADELAGIDRDLADAYAARSEGVDTIARAWRAIGELDEAIDDLLRHRLEVKALGDAARADGSHDRL
jgi:hypothetical protein